MRTPAFFLDRDGTLIRDIGYPSNPDDVVLLPGAAEALRVAKERGYRLIIVSNQSGVARGYFDEAIAHKVQLRVNELFADENVVFDGVYFCFHGPTDGCDCRKPEPGMLLSAARDLDVDLAQSIMIGDKVSDIEAGYRAGCRTTVALSPNPLKNAATTVSTWADLWPTLGN